MIVLVGASLGSGSGRSSVCVLEPQERQRRRLMNEDPAESVPLVGRRRSSLDAVYAGGQGRYANTAIIGSRFERGGVIPRDLLLDEPADVPVDDAEIGLEPTSTFVRARGDEPSVHTARRKPRPPSVEAAAVPAGQRNRRTRGHARLRLG